MVRVGCGPPVSTAHKEARRSRWGCCLIRWPLPCEFYRADEDPDPETEEQQVEDYLRGDEEASYLTGCGDVAETDLAEDRRGEIERVRAGERLGGEVVRTALSQQVVGRGV